MKNVTRFPVVPSGVSLDVIVLNCHQQLHFDPTPLVRLFAEKELHEAEDTVCQMLEDIAMRLDALQRALTSLDFDMMKRPARRIEMMADRLGLMEVAITAAHVLNCLKQRDGVALDATMARLERGFDIAVSEVWNFRDM